MDADMRTARFSWRGLVQHPSLLLADGEAEGLSCIREAPNDLPQDLLRVGEKGVVVGKQQLSDEFLNGFRACEETAKVKHAAICSETDIDAVWQVLQQCLGQDAPLLDAVGDGEDARQRPIVLHFTLLTLMELVEDG